MKLILIDPNRPDLYHNNLFNYRKYPSLRLFHDARVYLLKQNILFDTIDLHDVKSADQIFFFDHEPFYLFIRPKTYVKKCIELGIPRERLNLIIFECPVIKPENWQIKNHQLYGRVFTWNDSLVDNKKYFHYFWPQNTEAITRRIPFEKKKLLTLINAYKTNYLHNELYSLRIKIIRYLEKYHNNEFDLYGYGWNKRLELKNAYSALKYRPLSLITFITDFINSFTKLTTYRGTVKDKIATLSKYKFALCFENMGNIDGYITEKIFDCFKAECIPIYLGASNISDYIPESIFINFRKFDNFTKLYNYLTKIDKNEYDEIYQKTKKFLFEKLVRWSVRSFIYDILLRS